MSEGLKVLLGALGGAILALLLAGGLSGGGMGQMMGGGVIGDSSRFCSGRCSFFSSWQLWSGSSSRSSTGRHL
ncbi:MAG TPA: hypothetical protein VJ827_00460 [Rubrobacter sp.]|nr:hypothetical protein [Rubrobacter sp.]